MTETMKAQYEPQTVSPPGETLAETLEELEMSQAELARRMGRPIKTMNEIVQGKAAILPETALQLENVLGIPASFWMAREVASHGASALGAESDGGLARIDGVGKRIPLQGNGKVGLDSPGNAKGRFRAGAF
jgi:addiction module HigA family antidote